MDGPWRHAQWNNLVTKRQAAFYLVAQELPAPENHLGRVTWMSVFSPILLHVNFPTSKIFYLAGPELGRVVFLQDPQGICSHDENQPCHLLGDRFPKKLLDHLSETWGWVEGDDLRRRDRGGHVCRVRGFWRVFCMRGGMHEKLNWVKVEWKKESPLDASNIFGVIETRLDFWCLLGPFINCRCAKPQMTNF